MANKKIQIEFDFNTNDVKLAGEATLSLSQQIKVLKQELLKTKEGTREFEILKNKLNETKDNFDRVNTKSRELFGTLSLIPGPIGQIAGKLNGAVSLLKTFSGFSLKDVSSQFKALGEDIKNIFANFGNLFSVTKDVTSSQKELSQTTNTVVKDTALLSSNVLDAGASINALNASQQAATAAQKTATIVTQANSNALRLSELQAQRNILAQQLQTGEINKTVFAEKNAAIQREISTLSTQANTTATAQNSAAQSENAIAQEGAAAGATANAAANEALAVAETNAAVAGRVLRGVLASLGIGALIVLIGMIVGKVMELVEAMNQAKDKTEDYNRVLERQKQLYEDLASGIDQQTKIDVERAKQAGKSEEDIFKIRKEGLQKQLTETRNAANEAAAMENKFRAGSAKDFKISEEERVNQINKFNALKQELFNKEIQLGRQIELEGEQEKTRIAEQGRKKREKDGDDADKKKLDKQKAQLDAEIELEIRKEQTDETRLKELLKKRLELEKLSGNELLLAQDDNNKKLQEALNDDFNRELDLRKKKLDAQIETEKNAQVVNTEELITLLQQRAELELQTLNLTEEEKKAIIAKSESEIRGIRQDAREKQLTQDIQASRGDFEKQIELYRQFGEEVQKSENYNAAEKLRIQEETNQKIVQLNQQRFQQEQNDLLLKFGADYQYNQEYFDQLSALYDAEEARYKKLHDEKKITDAEYTEFQKQNRDARIKIQQDELKARTETFQAIGDIFTASANLAGEQTRAGKALAIAGATINTYSAANQVLADPLLPTFLKALKAAAIIINGLANVRRIASTQIPNAQGMGGSGGVINTGQINVQARRAQGGMIVGPGGETSDSIPALLSDGEYVINARSTRAFRPLLETINSAQNLPAFAVGGLVNGGKEPFKSQNETISEAISTAFGQTPIKTYVTATEVSTQQQFDRIIKSRSLI